MTQLKSCEAFLSPETLEDIAQMRNLYSLWAADAESNNFQFPSIDKNGEYTRKNAPITKYTRKFLPTGLLAIRLLHNPDPGSYGNLSPLDLMAETVLGKVLNNDAYEMLRAAHVASLIQAKTINNQTLIKVLNKRLQGRLDNDTDYITGKRTSSKIYKPDISGLFINAVNAGFPITDFQARHIYKSLEVADQTIPAHDPMFYVFDASTPDGEYTFEATDPGMPFRAIGLLFGSCSSAFKNADVNKVLNCQKIEDYFKSLK
ncbi:MAG: hypothetical protein H7336_14940 [Bacteriovorax sp.]|nr:hypothetical protein [Bacteriovorax sp.]